MTSKEKGFIALILFSIIAFVWAVSFSSNFWIIFGILALHISFAVSLASFSKHFWITIIFPIFWMMADLSSSINVFIYVFSIGFPMSYLYIMAQKNFKLRVKIAFSQSVRPALKQAFLISLTLKHSRMPSPDLTNNDLMHRCLFSIRYIFYMKMVRNHQDPAL